MRYVSIILAAAGLVSMGIALYFAARARAARSWPAVPGIITRSQFSESPDLQSTVEYSYSVNGAAYSSTRVMFGEAVGYHLFDRSFAARKYMVGQPVFVHYDPEDPPQAVLELGVSIGAAGSTILGAIAVALGTAPLWWPAVEPLTR